MRWKSLNTLYTSVVTRYILEKKSFFLLVNLITYYRYSDIYTSEYTSG